MSQFTISRRRSLWAAVLALAALAAPAALRAQSTTPKVFYACYVPSSGTTYRIKEADLKQECSKPTHAQFSWTDGTSAPGFSSIQTVYSEEKTVAPGTTGVAEADCPAGYKVIGGSFYIGNTGNMQFYSSNPNAAGTSWVVFIKSTDPSVTISFHAIAMCVK